MVGDTFIIVGLVHEEQLHSKPPISPELIEKILFTSHHSAPTFTVLLCAVSILPPYGTNPVVANPSNANRANEITLKRGLGGGRTHVLPCCYGYLQPVPESERLHPQQWVGKAQLRPELPAESDGTAESGQGRGEEKER